MAELTKSETLIVKAASLYYMTGLTQEQIAKQFGVSRPTVVRMLKKAVDEGYVEIRMTKKLPHTMELETQLQAKYAESQLNHIIVVENDGDIEDAKIAVGIAVAEYLEQNLKKDHILGIGWSSTLSHIPKYVKNLKASPHRVVQLGGYLQGLGTANAQNISIQLGNVLNTPVETIPAPVLLENSMVCQALLKDISVANTMKWVTNCNIGLVGIGVATKQSSLVQAGYLKEIEVEEVNKQGAEGEILSHYFDKNGKELVTPWSERMVSVDLETLKNINNLIGVAAGKDKANAVNSVIKSNIIDTLVIDVALAEALYALTF
ncbi:lsr operon transcriptional repressor [Colwellia chukchiensis]|uniref:Lsr operon transcriptional repressor n=1 Tax=Colwellia chukchiensis TaxID=641665 RepID=A0A1H7M4P4_9GAMM|nr:sugar-binding domain-containing protein [Colwellia chukchiensis]SEL05695.1 lsr operon transcriptional repressor [Colwellia chukchiensis]